MAAVDFGEKQKPTFYIIIYESLLNFFGNSFVFKRENLAPFEHNILLFVLCHYLRKYNIDQYTAQLRTNLNRCFLHIS